MTLGSSLSHLFYAAGPGALAGPAGSASTPVSSTLEAEARRREVSTTHARAADRAQEVHP